MDEFKELGTEFYVMGRHTDDTFLSLSDLPVPPDCQTIFHHLEGSHPASSSQLRQDG